MNYNFQVPLLKVCDNQTSPSPIVSRWASLDYFIISVIIT